VLLVGGGAAARRDVEARHERAAKARFVSIEPVPDSKLGVRVRFRISAAGTDDQVYQAVISATGDYHLSRVSPPLAANFDARTGTRTLYSIPTAQPASSTPQIQTQYALADAPPDDRDVISANGVLSRDLGAAVRAIAAEHPDQVTRVPGLPGRSALRHTQNGGAGKYIQTQVLTVDEKTGFPIEIEQRKADGTLVRALHVDTLEEGPLDAAELAPELPAAPVVPADNRNFQPMTVAKAAASVHYAVLLPRSAPGAYRLTRVTYAPAVADVKDQTNPSYADVVTLVYRDGLHSFTVTMRRAAFVAGPVVWSDPLLQGTSIDDTAQVERLTSGALAGLDAHVAISPYLWPHVWAQRDNVLVTIAGDLTRAQLLQVAKSLEPSTAP
jgi:hypothetical protein